MTETKKQPSHLSRQREEGTYCYISNSRSDDRRVSEICRAIGALGAKYYHNDRTLTGDELRGQLTEKIDACAVYVLFVTKALLAREDRFVRNEFFLAQKAGKEIHAVLLDEIHPGEIDGRLKKWWEEIREKCPLTEVPADTPPREVASRMAAFLPVVSPSVGKNRDEENAKQSGHPGTSGSGEDKESDKKGVEEKKNGEDKKSGKDKKNGGKKKLVLFSVIAAVLLLVVLGIFLLPGLFISADPDLFTYDVEGENVIITSLKDDEMTSVRIPGKIENKPVTKIGESAFSGSSNLKKVRMADSVTEIQRFAFLFCEELTDVQLSPSVVKIGESAFSDCTSLGSIKISRSVVEIGPSAFQGCTALKSVGISDSVRIIGESAFMNCTSLKKISLPDSVKALGGSVFEGCESLSEVRLSDNVSEICFSCFEGCVSLREIVIPDSVTEIGDYAFCGCDSLKKAVIPPSVGNIVPTAFEGCPNLTIYGKPGSAAEEFADVNDIPFVAS